MCRLTDEMCFDGNLNELSLVFGVLEFWSLRLFEFCQSFYVGILEFEYLTVLGERGRVLGFFVLLEGRIFIFLKI